MHLRGSIHKRVVRRGTQHCILLSQDELRELNLDDGDEVDVSITPCNHEVDWEALPHRRINRERPTRQQ